MACPDNKQIIDPAKLNGKVVLIDFWATWCPPCIQSMPFFNKLQHELKDEGFEILAVNVDEEQSVVTEFLKAHPVDYPIVYDPEGHCPRAYELKAMPSSYLLDKSGKIRQVFLGFRDSDQNTIKSEIKQLLTEK